jgi:hypothetical protein
MITRFLVAILSALLFAMMARAQEPSTPPSPPDECASTFEARLADAKRGLALYKAHMREYEKARPALEWFEAHCRFLNELELAIRKLDDPNAFVCDPGAGKRPKGLTSELVITYSTLPSQMTFQERQGENHMCERKDARDRIALTFHDLTEIEIIEVLCYADERPACVQARENIATLRKQGQR